MKKIFLIRHGYTKSKGIFDSSSFVSINLKGKESSLALGKWLSNRSIDVIYSSPIRRVLETSDYINKYLKVTLRIEKGFREIDFGDWQGKRYQEILHQYPNYLDQIRLKKGLFTFPNGENIARFNRRVWRALKQATSGVDRNIVIVTHKGVIESIVGKILSIPSVFPPLTITPTSCSILLFNDNIWTIGSLNTCVEN